MKVLEKISKIFKSKSIEETPQKDVYLEQKLSEFALTEIELRDK